MRAKNQLVMLRSDLVAIEADVVRYRNAISNAIDAPVTAVLQHEAWGWKLAIERASSALSYWIADIQREIDELAP
jgi:hypothetical protein